MKKSVFTFFGAVVFLVGFGFLQVELSAASIEAILTAKPASLTAYCPATIGFRGAIKVAKPCLVQYKFIRNDGASGPVVSLKCPAAGTYPVSDTWNLSATYSGWEAIEVISPEAVKSERATFALTCKPKPYIDSDFLNTKLYLEPDHKPVLQVSGTGFGPSQGTKNVTLDGQPVLPRPGWSLKSWWDQTILINIRVCDVTMWDKEYQLAVTDGGKIVSNVVPFRFRYQLFYPNDQKNYAVGQTLIVSVYGLPSTSTGISLGEWGSGVPYCPLVITGWTGAVGCNPGQITATIPQNAGSAGSYLALYKGWQMVSGEDLVINIALASKMIKVPLIKK